MRIIAIRKYIYILSLLIIIPGIVSLFYQGLNLGIDFTKGSILQVRFDKTVQVSEVRSVLSDFEVGDDAKIQTSGEKEVIIRTKTLTQNESNEIIKGFESKIGKTTLLRNDMVEPAFGKELRNKAFLGVGIACLLMLIYITIRFEFNFGVGAILALLHDVLVVVGVFSLFQWEVDSAFVAAILTILGYSINDTIVVFDRIRENLKLKRKETYDQIVDKSVMQTINRSINTVLTVVFCLVALLIFGGITIQGFVVAMLIGVVSGCYSSIFVASPIWYDLKIREDN
ncbi:MAG: protein translocase subunit SecF [Ignavibacteriales bacterium]